MVKNKNKNKIKLSDVTLVAVATTKIKETISALEYSMQSIDYEDILLITNTNIKSNDYRTAKINSFNSVSDWGEFIVFKLHNYIKTNYILLIHHDGFVVNPSSWDKHFLNYDYIGAPWPISKDGFSYLDNKKNIIRVGNSVSLRSKRLLELPSKLDLSWHNLDHGFFHEDGFLCVQSREVLLKNDIKFAPYEIAKFFSREYTFSDNKHLKPFVFHKWYGENRFFPCFEQKNIYERLKFFIKNMYLTIKFYV